MNTGVFHYSLQIIHSNKKTYFWDIVSYSMFIIIAIIVGLLGNSFFHSHEDYVTKKYGHYDACIINADLNDKKYVETVNNYYTNNCYITDFFYTSNDKYYALGYFDDKAYEQMSISLVSGRLPHARSEIAIEESALYMLSKYQNKNGTLTLELNDFNGNQYTETFEIVGIINNYSHLTPKMDGSDSEMPHHIFPSILIAPQNEASIIHTLVSVSNEEKLEGFDQDNYLINNYKSQNNITAVHIAFSLIFSLVIVLGFLSLYCNILVHKKKQQDLIYIMKCAGATNIACIRFRLITLSILLLLSIITGICIGIGISWLLVKFIQIYFVDYIIFYNSFTVVCISVLIAAVTIILFSLLFDISLCYRRPLQINTENNQNSKGLHIKTRFFIRHPILSLAIKDVYANTGKYTSIIFSIFSMLALTIVTQLLVSSIIQSYNVAMSYDYLIESYNGGTMTSFAIPTTNYHFTDEDVENLATNNETSSCYAYSRNLMYVLLNDSEEEPPRQVFVNHKEDYSQTEERIQYLAEEYMKYGYDADARLYTVELFGVNDTFLVDLLSDDVAADNIGKQVVLFTTNDSGFYQENDTIVFTAPRLNSNGQITRVDIETTIGKIVIIDNSNPFYYNLYNGSGYFFCISQEVINEKIANGYHTLFINLSNPSQYTETERILNQLDVIHGDELQYQYISNREYNEEKQESITLTKTIGGIIIIAISLYSGVTLITIFRNDLNNRKRVWGYLRASGLTYHQSVVIQCSIVFLLNILAFIFILALIGIIFIISEDYDRLYFSSILSPISVFLPPVITSILTQSVGITVLTQFWKKKTIELIR